MEVRLVLYGQGAYLAGTQTFGQIASYISEHEVRPDSRLRRRSEPDWWRDESISARNLPSPCAAPPCDVSASMAMPREEAEEESCASVSFDEEGECQIAPAPEFAAQLRAPDRSMSPVESRRVDPDETEANLRRYMERLPRTETFADYLLNLIDSRGMKDSEVYTNANMDRRLFSKIRSIPGYTPKKENVFALCMALKLRVHEAEALLAKAGYAFSDASRLDLAVRWYLEYGDWDLFQLNLILAELRLPQLGSGV